MSDITGYTSWSVVFGEQPSAAKWNILGTNDAAFNTALTGSGTINSTVLNNPYKFSAYRNAGSLTLSSTANTQVTFDSEDFDTGSNFASSTFTAPIAGFYWLNFAVQYASVASLQRVFAMIYLNGSERLRGDDKYANATSGGATVSGFLHLAANDTITFWARAVGASSAVTNGQNATYCSGFLVSAT